MSITEASITINAPLEKVFAAIADPEVLDKISSGTLVGVGGINGELGSYADWKYLKFLSRTTVSEVNKPFKLVHEMTGAMPGRWVWKLAQEGQAVKVDFSIEYSVPGGIIEKILDNLFMGRINEKAGVKTMQGLKSYCEEKGE